MERRVQSVLEKAGDLAGAFLWRRVCRDLDGPLRVGIVARDPEAGRRMVRGLPEREDVEWVPIHLETDDDGLGLGAQERLLGVHALLFGTPMTAALGATERESLGQLGEGGGPVLRAVTAVDAQLLERLSDDPEAERELVYARLETLLPDSWPLLQHTEVVGWLDAIEVSDTTAVRRGEVARFLLDESAERIGESLEGARARLAEIDGLLAEEDSVLAEARKKGERIAAHTLAVIRRQTEQLDLDLQEFLRTVEGDLPEQVREMDVRTARRVLPHWLTHVVEKWISDRAAQWRRDVLAELEDIDIEEVVRAELLVPALQPAPVKGEPRCGRRLGTTAAFGGAAALLAFGMWIPGLVALAGGVVWSTFNRGESEEASRQKLVATARTALRQMGQDAQRMLRDQIDQLSEELEGLGNEGESKARDARGDTRVQLQQRRDRQALEVDELEAAVDILVAGRAALEVA